MRPAHGVSSENKPQRAQRKKDQTHIVHLRPVFIHGRAPTLCLQMLRKLDVGEKSSAFICSHPFHPRTNKRKTPVLGQGRAFV
jgi:hypothetical protein